MKRFEEKIVFFGFVTDCLFAATPTRISALSLYATTEGVVRFPSAFAITCGSPPSMTAMQEFVVPRSMPRILDMGEWGSCQAAFKRYALFDRCMIMLSAVEITSSGSISPDGMPGDSLRSCSTILDDCRRSSRISRCSGQEAYPSK